MINSVSPLPANKVCFGTSAKFGMFYSETLDKKIPQDSFNPNSYAFETPRVSPKEKDFEQKAVQKIVDAYNAVIAQDPFKEQWEKNSFKTSTLGALAVMTEMVDKGILPVRKCLEKMLEIPKLMESAQQQQDFNYGYAIPLMNMTHDLEEAESIINDAMAPIDTTPGARGGSDIGGGW